MPTLIIIIFIISICLYLGSLQGQESKIQNKIESMGGKVINIERRSFFTGLGPFMVVGKGRTVYRIEYDIDGDVKEGWVRFGGLFGPDWRL